MYVRTVGRQGFTLIELLVVIAIIAILAAILFPVFARARENARKSNCQSNLKQIGLALRSYSQDYDERYPCYRFFDNIPEVTYSWRIALLPYVKNRGIFVCPSAPNLNGFALSTNDRSDCTADLVFLSSGYYCNSVHYDSGAPNPPFMHRRQGGISDAQIAQLGTDTTWGVTPAPDRLNSRLKAVAKAARIASVAAAWAGDWVDVMAAF